MSRIWVDPPGGWRYGFPKLYDEAVDGALPEWLKAQGYPEEPEYLRCWSEEESDV